MKNIHLSLGNYRKISLIPPQDDEGGRGGFFQVFTFQNDIENNCFTSREVNNFTLTPSNLI